MPELRGLLVDYGGVLTTPPAESFHRWLQQDGVDVATFRALMRQWFAADADPNIVHDLETGRITPEDFERRLAGQLAGADGEAPPNVGLLGRMFAGFRSEQAMIEVVRRARASGLRTGVVSNSWGFDYPDDTWGELFDAVVISGQEGVRKPDPEIYLLAAERVGLPPAACVFVDDLAANVRGAAAVGMVGVQHTTVEGTVAELEILFGLSLRECS